MGASASQDGRCGADLLEDPPGERSPGLAPRPSHRLVFPVAPPQVTLITAQAPSRLVHKMSSFLETGSFSL